MLDANAYAEALNAALAAVPGAYEQLPASVLPAKGRPRAVEEWCTAHGVPTPSKTVVAYRVLELIADGRSVVAANRRLVLNRAYERLANALNLDDLLM